MDSLKKPVSGHTLIEFLISLSITSILLTLTTPTIVAQGTYLRKKSLSRQLELKEERFESTLRNLVENSPQLLTLNRISIAEQRLTTIIPTAFLKKNIQTTQGNFLRACGDSSKTNDAKGWAAVSIEGISFLKFNKDSYKYEGNCISGTIQKVSIINYPPTRLKINNALIAIKDIVEIGLEKDGEIYYKSQLTNHKQTLFKQFEKLEITTSTSGAIKVTFRISNRSEKTFYIANKAKSASHLELLL